MSKTVHLTIEGMHCGSCVRRVTNVLGSVEGVQTEEVAVGSATVAYDSDRVNLNMIAAAVEKIGFSIKEMRYAGA